MLRIEKIKINVLEYNFSKLQSKVEAILKTKIKSIQIVKKSLDARKDDLYYVFVVDALVSNEKKVLNRKVKNVYLAPKEEYVFPRLGKEKIELLL